jgi:hypothetical protein
MAVARIGLGRSIFKGKNILHFLVKKLKYWKQLQNTSVNGKNEKLKTSQMRL